MASKIIFVPLLLAALVPTSALKSYEDRPRRHQQQENEVAANAVDALQREAQQRHLAAVKRRSEAEAETFERQQARSRAKETAAAEYAAHQAEVQKARTESEAAHEAEKQESITRRKAEGQRIEAAHALARKSESDAKERAELRKREKLKETAEIAKKAKLHEAMQRKEAKEEERLAKMHVSGKQKLETREKAREALRAKEERKYAEKKAKRERQLEEDRLTIQRRQEERRREKYMKATERNLKAHLQEQSREALHERVVALERKKEDYAFEDHILRAAHSQRKANTEDAPEVRRGSVPTIHLARLSQADLKEVMKGFISIAHRHEILQFISEATVESQKNLMKYVLGIKRKATTFLNHSVHLDEQEFIHLLADFFDDAVKLSAEQSRESAGIARYVMKALPAKAGMLLNPVITMMTPTIDVPALHTEQWRNSSNHDACGIFALNKARLIPYWNNARHIHEALNATAQTLPLLNHVDRSFNSDVETVANNLLHLGYMQVISLEEVGHDIINRFSHLLLKRLHCPAH